MLVFKFGGASVKNADAVRNVARIISNYPNQKLIVVVSAMGKTTNALENVVDALWNKDKSRFNGYIDEIATYHISILKDLSLPENHPSFIKIIDLFEKLKNRFEERKLENYNYEYDQVVSLGEILSTIIVEAHLNSSIKSNWLDCRKLIQTDALHRNANVVWNTTEKLVVKNLIPQLNKYDCIVTQGFIGCSSDNSTTTLGREGSDYTAGILAYCVNAESVTIWKDVPGMLNADPKIFKNTKKLGNISFREAIELSYYGASVIHPKTVKPLQNKQITLYVKSFIQPNESGTKIDSNMDYDHLIPSFIMKQKQILFSVSSKDFSFIIEENLSDIFAIISKLGLKINLMQNSALSFSFALDREKVNLSMLLSTLNKNYTTKYNDDLELVTIRHYDQKTINLVTNKKEIILAQKTRHTARFLMKPY
jgi:aspartate kinase